MAASCRRNDIKKNSVLCECYCQYDALSPIVISQQRGAATELRSRQGMLSHAVEQAVLGVSLALLCGKALHAGHPMPGFLLRRNDITRMFSVCYGYF